MSSSIPSIPALNLRQLPSTKSGLIDATNANDPNRAILQTEQNFTQILQTLQTDPNASQSNTSNNSNSFDNNFNFAAGLTSNPLGTSSSATGQDIFSVLNNSFSSLNTSSFSGIQSTQQALTALQKLSALTENTALLGQWVQYVNANNEVVVGKVRKIILDSNGLPQIELADGTKISPNQVSGLAENQEDANV